MKLIKQNAGAIIPIGPAVDDADGYTAEVALAIAQGDVRIFKAGATGFVQKANAGTLTHMEGGWYRLVLVAADTDTLGLISIYVKKNGALHLIWEGMVVHPDVYDAIVMGTRGIRSNPWGENRIGNSTAGTFGEGVTNVMGSVYGAVGEVIGNVGGVAANGIQPTSFQDGAITALAVAPDAIGAVQISDPAVTKIQLGLATSTFVGAIGDLVVDISSRIPTVLIAGRMDSRVGAMANDIIGSATVSTGAADKIGLAAAAKVWGALRATYAAAGTFGQGVSSVQGAVTGSVASVTGAVGSVAAGGISAASATAGFANKVADHVLRRPLASAVASADGDAHPSMNARSLLGVARMIRNRVSRDANVVSYYAENDVTVVGTATVTPAASAPVSAVDPD